MKHMNCNWALIAACATTLVLFSGCGKQNEGATTTPAQQSGSSFSGKERQKEVNTVEGLAETQATCDKIAGKYKVDTSHAFGNWTYKILSVDEIKSIYAKAYDRKYNAN